MLRLILTSLVLLNHLAAATNIAVHRLVVQFVLLIEAAAYFPHL